MKERIILIYIYFFYGIITAQTIHVSGSISTSTQAVKNVLVVFTNENDTTQSYTAVTDSLGNYRIGLITSIEENTSVIPTKFELAQNYPNPFANSTAISYKLNQQSYVHVTIYDILGREVKKFNIGEQPIGIHGVLWDGRNNFGEKATTGIYFYQLMAGKETYVNKMVLTRGSIGDNIPLSGNFSSLTKLNKETSIKNNPEFYTVKIMNTDSTKPRIAAREIKNVTITKDTTIDYRVNKLPIANAGEDSKVKVGQYVILDGTKSVVGDGSELHYHWEADTTNPVKINLLFLQPQVPVGFVKEGTYRFTLVLNDGIADSEPDEVVVEVGARGESKFEDPVMELYVRYELKDPTGELTDEKLASLNTLTSQAIFGKVTSLSGIEKCSNLTRLTFGLNSITDLTPLSGLTKLEDLALDQNRTFTDISPLASLINLTTLNLGSNNISDISALKKLTKLKTLTLLYNPIDDIAALEDMKELKGLWISYPTQGGPLLKNTQVISEFKKLDHLWLGELDIGDISFVSTLTELIYLRLSFCNVTDISAIANCTKLVRLYLDSNNITNITPLEGLTDINLLDLRYNQITNIVPLVKNSGLGKGDAVSLTGNPLDDISINQYIPELKDRGVTVFY